MAEDVPYLGSENGRRRAAPASSPVRLDGDVAVRVVAGSLDVFLEDSTDLLDGRRHLLGSAPSGMLVHLPAGTAPDGWRALGIGRPDTEVVELDGETMGALPASELAANEATLLRSLSAANPTVSTLADLARERLAGAEQRQAVLGDRLRAGAVAQDDELRRVLSRLVDVVEGGAPASIEGQDEQLTAALDALDPGGEQPSPRAVPMSDTNASEALRARGRRHRVVTLPPDWWRRTGSPLLGFAEEGRVPVALVPRRRGYEAFYPSTGSRAPVDAATAATLAAVALAVYPRLPIDAGARPMLAAIVARLRPELLAVAAWSLLAGLITALTPAGVALVFDAVLPARSPSLLAALGALLLGGALAWGVVAAVQGIAGLRLAARLTELLDPGVTDRWLRLPSALFRRLESGDLASRASGLQTIREQLANGALGVALTALSSLVNLGVLLVYSVPLGLGALATIVLMLVVVIRLSRRSVAHQAAMFDKSGEVSSLLFQSVRAIDKLRVAGAERRVMTRWSRLFRAQEEHAVASGRLQAAIVTIASAGPLVLGLLLYVGATSLLLGRLSAGQFLAVSTALGQFATTLAAASTSVAPILTVVPLWRRLGPLLDEPLPPEGPEDPGLLGGRLSARAVSFSYDATDHRSATGRRVLDGVDLDVEPGEFVAVTGPSGSGKSTLLRLLLGLDRPDAGVVRYDGVDLASLDGQAVRRQVGVVMQGARPLPGPIISTILGLSDGDESTAWAALEAAGLANDVQRMPMGLQTVVGEGGTTFSGGQVQRLMIARALASRPRVLFLDEATSALDDVTQERVSRHLERLDTTRVVIAHRLSTIRRADRIVVLDEGRVVQLGTYEELTRAEGLFRLLVDRQSVTGAASSERKGE